MKKTKKSALEQLAPLYVVIIPAVYVAFLIYWRHSTWAGNQINWDAWIVGASALMLIPLVFVINHRWENDKSVQAARDLVRFRLLMGPALVLMPFIFMASSDTTKGLGDYHTTDSGAPGINSLIQPKVLFIILNAVPMILGLFLVFLGRGKLISRISLLKLLAALVVAAGLMVVLLFYSFAKYYQF